MNRIENCDNLDLMRSLPDNHIDLIYCDILYGTGRNFGDYQDLKPIRSEIEAHYIPRIKEMHRILKDTGSIYLQMDCNISHWVRLILDDIFGYGKFVNQIVWCYSLGGKSKNCFSKKHDIILFYTKSNYYTFTPIKINRKPNSHMKVGVDEEGRKYQEKVDKKSGKVYRYYLDEGKVAEDYWTDIETLNREDKERLRYQTQKPKALIERIIKASSNEGDLVADFYMGSGTTAEVCQDLNRNFIGCDINPRAIEMTKKRLDKARNLFSNCG